VYSIRGDSYLLSLLLLLQSSQPDPKNHYQLFHQQSSGSLCCRSLLLFYIYTNALFNTSLPFCFRCNRQPTFIYCICICTAFFQRVRSFIDRILDQLDHQTIYYLHLLLLSLFRPRDTPWYLDAVDVVTPFLLGSAVLGSITIFSATDSEYRTRKPPIALFPVLQHLAGFLQQHQLQPQTSI